MFPSKGVVSSSVTSPTSMAKYVIKNRVPSAEEMGRMLGMSKKRIDAVRRIMNSPVRIAGRTIMQRLAKPHSRKADSV